MGAVIDPSFIGTEPYRIHVDTTDTPTRGMTIRYRSNKEVRDPPNCRVAIAADAERFVRLFLDRMKG